MRNVCMLAFIQELFQNNVSLVDGTSVSLLGGTSGSSGSSLVKHWPLISKKINAAVSLFVYSFHTEKIYKFDQKFAQWKVNF